MISTNLKERELINFIHTLEQKSISADNLDFIVLFLEHLESRGLRPSELVDDEVLDFMDDTISELEHALQKEKAVVAGLKEKLEGKEQACFEEIEVLKKENQILKDTVTKQLVLKKVLKEFLN